MFNNILVNNYKALYLINDKFKLIPGVFKKAKSRKVKSGTFFLPITGINI